MDGDQVGYQVSAVDFAVKASGRPVAIYSVFVDSDGVGAGLVRLYDGTSADATKVIYAFIESGANITATHRLAGGNGVVFPRGCYVQAAANIDSVTIAYKTVGV